MVIGQYRERGVLRRLGVTPVRPLTLLLADMTVWAAAAVALGGDGHRGGPDRLPRAGATAAPGWFVLTVAPRHRLAVHGRPARRGRGADRQERGRASAGCCSSRTCSWPASTSPARRCPPTMRQIGNFTPLGSALHAVRDSWMGITPRPEYLGIMAAWPWSREPWRPASSAGNRRREGECGDGAHAGQRPRIDRAAVRVAPAAGALPAARRPAPPLFPLPEPDRRRVRYHRRRRRGGGSLDYSG